MNCTEVVSTVDCTPIRSPQVIHTALLPHLTGRSVVEIGTRNGDGMMCFARVARSATAIELQSSYCAKLRARSAELKEATGSSFEVFCKDYHHQTMPDADVYTWWQQGRSLSNLGILQVLRRKQEAGLIRQSAQFAFVVDYKWERDRSSWNYVKSQGWADWEHHLHANEFKLCQTKCKYKQCGRAVGKFAVVGGRLSNVSIGARPASPITAG